MLEVAERNEAVERLARHLWRTNGVPHLDDFHAAQHWEWLPPSARRQWIDRATVLLDVAIPESVPPYPGGGEIEPAGGEPT